MSLIGAAIEKNNPVLYVEFRKDGGSIDPGPNDTGNANFGYLFRFAPPSYQYNLKTDLLTPGSHTLFFTVSTVPGDTKNPNPTPGAPATPPGGAK